MHGIEWLNRPGTVGESEADRIPFEDLRLSTEVLCEKHSISRTTAWRWRDAAGIKKFGPPDPIEQLAETDKAYLAGLIDADGCITVLKTRRTAYPSVCVAQTKFDALEWMAEKLGATVSFHARSREDRGGYHREQMIVRLHGARAQLLCKAILPYLKIKRRQAEIVIGFPCDVRDRGLTEDINAIRFEMLAEIQGLNEHHSGKKGES